ncbi:MAG: UvrD-helicase domain-containing protein, partial [Rubrivivax sp.]
MLQLAKQLLGLPTPVRVLSKAEQFVFLRTHLFELPLERFRPSHDPTRYVEALVTVFSRAKDEAVTPEAFLAYADAMRGTEHDALSRELAHAYAAYQQLLAREHAMDFGDQMLSAITLCEREPELLSRLQQHVRYLLVDEFQDTNFAQFRVLQLLASPAANVTVVADDDQSIYKWRGAAISNVLKFLEHYHDVRRIVLTENFRSTQAILDSAYRLIRHNDPDRLEVKEQIDKRLVAVSHAQGEEPGLRLFETASQEADWVAREIQTQVGAGTRAPGDFAILVR